MATQAIEAAPFSIPSLIDRSRITTLLAVAAAISIIIAVALWARAPEYRPLYASLPDRDANAVIQSLQQMNVPFRMAEGGGAILVPATQVHDIRLKLASQGIPRNGTPGFELFETQKWGVTQFQEQVTFQRALEGELARSIQSLSAVQGARVHLAIPKDSGFLREQQAPTASVLLNLAGGQSLERSQIAGIVHLVASSVNNLSPRGVSVVDQNGTLLSSEFGVESRLDPGQLAHVQRIETGYARRLAQILTPIVGQSNYRAQVNADIDFTETETSNESYKPNRGATDAVVRSEQTSEGASATGNGAQGVPGAQSNQPPAASQAPINGSVTSSGDVKNPSSTQRNTVTNYEVDKTVRYSRPQVGAVRRLSTAIVINLRKPADPTGKPEPLSEAEIQNITELAKQAIGFREDRGDTIKVTSAPFTAEPIEPIADVPLWKRPDLIALAVEAGKYLLAALLIAYVFFAYVKPALKHLIGARMVEEPGPAALPAPGETTRAGNAVSTHANPGAGNGDTVAALPAPDPLEEARQIARQDPKMVANLVTGWVNNG